MVCLTASSMSLYLGNVPVISELGTTVCDPAIRRKLSISYIQWLGLLAHKTDQVDTTELRSLLLQYVG